MHRVICGKRYSVWRKLLLRSDFVAKGKQGGEQEKWMC